MALKFKYFFRFYDSADTRLSTQSHCSEICWS